MAACITTFRPKQTLGRSIYLSTLKDYQQQLLGALDAAPSAAVGVRALVMHHIDWVLHSPRKALVLDRLRSFTVIDGGEPDWDAANAEPFSHLRSWIALQVARGEMQKLPFKVWLALVLGPSMQLTAGWARQARPSVEPRVRNALSGSSLVGGVCPASAKGRK